MYIEHKVHKNNNAPSERISPKISPRIANKEKPS